MSAAKQLVEIPAPTRSAQQRASNPQSSAWVSANAGSGKTHVLVQRVLRLLLAGEAPSRILCLTFTKAAAANMSARVFRELASWTRLRDEELSREIVAVAGGGPSAAELNSARRLFARTIETPGGLKIQTLHAFCERILHHFPFEANVAAGFRVVEEREAADLLHEARTEAFAEARDATDLSNALNRIAKTAGADKFDDLLAETLRRREAISSFTDADAYAAELRRRLGLRLDETEDAIKNQMRNGGGGPGLWREWARKLLQGSANDKKRAAELIDAAGIPEPGPALEAFLEAFFTEKGPRSSLTTNPLAERFPELREELTAEQNRLGPLRNRWNSTKAVERSGALARVAGAMLARYARLKNERGFLDFDDLIARTLALLGNVDAAWVLYKLDSGIDHILVDEAQDTSRAQWDILRKLASDFLAGESARSRKRTFFAVGDEKQSIFSFQGAAPTMFDAMRREFQRSHANAQLAFETISLNLSFRSAPEVLKGVDLVFASETVWRGVSAGDDKPPPHVAFRAALPGVVEIWTPIAAPEMPNPEDWRMPLDAVSRYDPAVVLADRIAYVIEGWLSPTSKESVTDTTTGQPRRVKAGDILILVRKRGLLFEALTRALRRKAIASAGADRMTLRDHIAVMDLVAAGRAALSEDDDLSLAAVLKSPLIGLDDDALLHLAPGRTGPLAIALAHNADEDFAMARERIVQWRARAAQLSPFDFYAHLLGADGGRRALLGRLGAEAADAIDEFMAVALAFERQDSPSLPAFLAEIEASDVAIKRDMELESSGVRVMTVHASKGLEAPIVILPDTCSAPGGRHDPNWLELPARSSGDPTLYVWAAKKGDDSEALAAARLTAREAAAGEHRRLLYVAMTRAAQRLIVAGFEGANGRPEDSWYNLIRLGLDPVLKEGPAPWSAQETVWRLGAGAGPHLPFAVETQEAVTTPAWLYLPPMRESARIALTPSRAAPPSRTGSYAARREQLEIGRLVHTLMQQLPDISPERRRVAAERFLERNASAFDAGRREPLIERVLEILTHPELAPLFAAGSRAEVAIAGAFPQPGRPELIVSGRIDRLAVMEDAVLLADFKTGWDPGGAPAAYVEQLALYRAALAQLQPNREIRAMLIWIETGRIATIAPAALDEALSQAVDRAQP